MSFKLYTIMAAFVAAFTLSIQTQSTDAFRLTALQARKLQAALEAFEQDDDEVARYGQYHSHKRASSNRYHDDEEEEEEESEEIFESPYVTKPYSPSFFDEEYDEYSLQASTYTVVSGDTLTRIANRNGCTVAELVKINRLANANLIRIGQVLTLCGSSPSPTPTPTPTPSPSPTPTPTPSGKFKMSEAGFNYLANNLSKLSQTKINNINLIINAANTYGITDIRQVAYILATTYGESGFIPQEEGGYQKDGGKAHQAAVCPKYCVDGINYFGRGFVQLTWKNNYKKMGDKLGYDFCTKAGVQLTMVPEIATKILVVGMKDGSFTGKSLKSYINDSGADYVNARRIINGTSGAEKFANYARIAEHALRL